MMPTKAMIIAARRAEFDYYQKSRKLGAGRFIGTPDEVIKVMLEAALKAGSSGRTTCRNIGSDDPTSTRVIGLHRHHDKAEAMMPAVRTVLRTCVTA
jgi:hypothetical protein